MKRKAAAAYATESHLCDVFVEQLRKRAPEVAVHPEVDSWDLLLVVPAATAARWWRCAVEGADVRVAIEAKLRPGIPLLAQALHRLRRYARRPDGAALLVPLRTLPLEEVAFALGFAVWSPGRDYLFAPPWLEGDSRPRIEPPEFEVPHLRAGAPAPRPLTQWRERAIRLCLRLRERGFVTSADFRELGISPRWWTGPGGVLVRDGEDEKRRRRFVARAGAELPDAGWEAVAEQIRDRDRSAA